MCGWCGCGTGVRASTHYRVALRQHRAANRLSRSGLDSAGIRCWCICHRRAARGFIGRTGRWTAESGSGGCTTAWTRSPLATIARFAADCSSCHHRRLSYRRRPGGSRGHRRLRGGSWIRHRRYRLGADLVSGTAHLDPTSGIRARISSGRGERGDDTRGLRAIGAVDSGRQHIHPASSAERTSEHGASVRKPAGVGELLLGHEDSRSGWSGT